MSLYKTIFTLIALLPLILFPPPALALSCEDANVEIFFGNGMFNSRLAATAGSRALEKRLHKEKILPEDQLVGLAYNTNEPALIQLLQVARQKDAEKSARFYLWLADLSLAPDFFRKDAIKVAQQIHAEAYAKDHDHYEQLEQYEDRIAKGAVLTVVAHSQGNFYANAAWRAIKAKTGQESRFSIVGVATPTNSTESGGPHTTLTQDQVINAVRLLRESLPANVTNSQASVSGHEFVSQYVHGDKSGPKMISEIKQAVTGLVRKFARPTKSELAYQDPSLKPLLHHACMLKSLNRKLTDGECIALTALDRTYSWFGEPREERSVKGLQAWISGCAKNYWHDEDRFDFLHCSPLGAGSGLDFQGLGSPLKLGFVVTDHPECHWHGSEVMRRTTSLAIQEARDLIDGKRSAD